MGMAVYWAKIKTDPLGNSPAVQWLGLGAFTARGVGSIPGWGTKIPQAMQCGQKTKTKNRLSLKILQELEVFS